MSPHRHRLSASLLLGTAAWLGMLSSVLAASGDERRIVGWIEPTTVTAAHYKVTAKLDTGADHSSLHARHIRRFEKQGEDWVRFDIRLINDELVTLERPLVRTARIRARR